MTAHFLSSARKRASHGGFSRANGLAILAGLVVAGMGIPAYLQWKVPELEAERDRIRAEAPSEPEAELAYWFRFGQPQVHHALVTARFSAARPWYVSHVVTSADAGQPPQVWGIDLKGLDPDQAIRLEGMTVRVVLPEPRLLAREPLVGTKAQGVPRFAAGQPVDAADLARRRLERYFETFATALGRDVSGARLVVQVGAARSEEGE